MPPAVLSPSDLGSIEDELIAVGGRVIEVDADAITLADAFTSVSIGGAPIAAALALGDLAVGDHAVISLRRTPAGFSCEDVLASHRPLRADRARASGQGETARLVHRGVGPNLVARALAFDAIRAFFAERRFLEVDTPAVVPSPGLDLHLDASPADGRWLITSPEYQMKRLLVGGVPRAYQMAHVFRRGELGERHNPEFTMLEWYRAFASVDEVMADTEELVARVVHTLTGGLELACPRANVAVEPPFERLTVADAFARYAGTPGDDALALAERDEEAFYRTLVDIVEPALALEPRAIFLTDYPIAQASLARARPDNPRVCERFELYVGGVELCNGFGELTDAREQKRRLVRDQKARADAKKPVYPIDERFLAALEEGMPPSAGNALGVDRLIALCAQAPAIAEVMPFPAEWL